MPYSFWSVKQTFWHGMVSVNCLVLFRCGHSKMSACVFANAKVRNNLLYFLVSDYTFEQVTQRNLVNLKHLVLDYFR